MAIDKESLVDNVLNDGAKVLNGLIPTGLATNPNTGEDFRAYSGDYNLYDLEAAKEEWEKAQAEIGESTTLRLLVTDDDNGQKSGSTCKANCKKTCQACRSPSTNSHVPA